jgi:hypothetical protein
MSTPDSTTTSVQSPEHATFVDERPESSDPLLQNTPIDATAPLTLPDAKMTAEHLLMNPIQIGSFSWSTSSPRESILESIDLPAAFTEHNSFHKAILGIYAFFKCNLVLTVKLNSTRFHAGAIWVFADPMHQMLDDIPSASSQTKFVNVWSASSQPRAEIDAAESNPAELRIPFEHIQDRLTTNSKETWDVMSRVRIMVASPLKAAVGTLGTVSGLVFLHCEDVSLDTPIYPHTATIPSLMHSDDNPISLPDSALGDIPPYVPLPPTLSQHFILNKIRALIRESNRLTTKIQATNEQIKSFLRLLPSAPVETEMHGLFDDIGDVVKGVTGAVYNVATGNFGKAATSASKGFSGAGKILTSFNLDKPNDPSTAVRNTIYPIAPISHGTGIDRSVRLGNAPLGSYLEERYSSSGQLDMDLYSRVQIPGLVNIFLWSTDATVGENLLSIPVLPSYCNTEAVVDPFLVPNFVRNYNTNLSYFAEMFIYWRMTMIYSLKAYCTQFHAGRLMLTFTPNQRLTPPGSLSQYTNLPAVYFDIQGSNISTVAVPFDSSLTRKTYAPWGSTVNRSYYTDQHILGYLDIVVVNRLVAPSNVTPSVEMFLFQSAGPDVEFESPRLLTGTQFLVPSLLSLTEKDGIIDSTELDEPFETVMHSGDLDVTSRVAPKPEFLAKNASLVPRMNVFNEGVRDLRELSRRFTPIQFQTAIFSNGYQSNDSQLPLWYIGKPFERPLGFQVAPLMQTLDIINWGDATTTPPQHISSLNVGSAYSFHNRIARCNVFYHGGMRFKIIPLTTRNRNLTLSASYLPDQGIIPDRVNGQYSASQFYFDKSAYSTMITNTAQQSALEIETPFMSGYNQLVTETVEVSTSFPPDVLNAGVVQIDGITDSPADFPVIDVPTTPSTTAPALSFFVLSATADDAVFHYAVAPPVTYTSQGLVPPP